MYKHTSLLIITLICLFLSFASFANTNIDNMQPCAMKNMDVLCHKGKMLAVLQKRVKMAKVLNGLTEKMPSHFL